MNELFFLPENIKRRDEVDILLVTGDCYIDHPSFGIAIIARVLSDAGFSVCIASQIEYFNKDYLNILPNVKLFIGISSGNLDSAVANYSSLRNERKDNPYSINGEVFFENGQKRRPDRALIIYTSFLKQRYKNTKIVLGGVEASIRRFAHYDFVQQKLRQSTLSDAKGDILVYGMGEKAVIEIASRLQSDQSLFGINGTCVRVKESEVEEDRIKSLKPIKLYSINDLAINNSLLIKNMETLESNMVYDKSTPLLQKQNSEYILSFIPQKPLSTEEIDSIYALNFRKDFPEYCKSVPAWKMINSSITTHRGCYGKCSFCAITIHQGPSISERSHQSIIDEAKLLSEKSFFNKTISDVGGPTANMYGTTCRIGWCKDPTCLYPTICEHLVIDKDSYKNLLESVKGIKNVKNVFVSSGLRHDLALTKKEESEFIIVNNTSGHLKIAPEHIDNEILNLMRKPPNEEFIKFIDFFESVKKKHNLKFYILPYLILSFPGSNDEKVKKLALFLKKNDIKTFQYQDFTPIPQTMATAIHFAKEDLDAKKINIISPSSINKREREILEKILNQSSSKR